MEVSDRSFLPFELISATNRRGDFTSEMIVAGFGQDLATSTEAASTTDLPTALAGKQPNFRGLDQLNALIPRSLIGSGEVDVEVIVDGISANKVKIALK